MKRARCREIMILKIKNYFQKALDELRRTQYNLSSPVKIAAFLK
jgi:hypothetical protein